MADLPGLAPGAFDKLDAEEDEVFYEPARLVLHIDDGAVAALTEFYRGGAAGGRRIARPDVELGQPPAARNRLCARSSATA